MAEAEVKIPKPAEEPAEDELEEDEEEEPDEEQEPAKEASWEPELMELKGKLSDLSTEVRALNQRSQEQTTLLQSSQEQTRKIQGDQQTILEKVTQLTPQQSPAKPSNEPKLENESESELTKRPENISDEGQQSAKSEDQKPPQPPAEKPLRRRRWI